MQTIYYTSAFRASRQRVASGRFAESSSGGAATQVSGESSTTSAKGGLVLDQLEGVLNEFGLQENVDYTRAELEEPVEMAAIYPEYAAETNKQSTSTTEETGVADETSTEYCEGFRTEVYWYHPNYLGSVDLVTDISGSVHQFFLYNSCSRRDLPFASLKRGKGLARPNPDSGARREGENMNEYNAQSVGFDSPYRFNGKELDEETGLAYYGARYYDNQLSMWLSVDAMAMNPHNMPLTPYHFSANNPVNMVDPDGNDWYVTSTEGSSDDPIWLPADAAANEVFGEGNWVNLGESVIGEVQVGPGADNSSAPKNYSAPPQLLSAKGEYGVKENTSATEHNSRVLEYHSTTNNPETADPDDHYQNDEVPWCASFANWNVIQAGLPANENEFNSTASSYHQWNESVRILEKPALGAFAIIKTGSQWHVTMVIGTNGKYIHGYGGNQANQVKISTYNTSNVMRYVMPIGVEPNYNVPTINHNFNSRGNDSTR